MTTNQTIDGVPRDYLLRLTPEAHSVMLGMVEHCLNVRACMGMDEGFKDFDTEEEQDFVKELRALLDAPAHPNRLCHIDYTAHPYICGCLKGDEEAQRRFDEHQAKATRPRGEPVYQVSDGVNGWSDVDLLRYTACCLDPEEYECRVLYVEQPVPVAVVPDGYCIMPRRLTAENGAKALLLGEFKLVATHVCPECRELEEPIEGCEICDGEGEYAQQYTIPWDQIKFIYSKAVSGLALRNDSK